MISLIKVFLILYLVLVFRIIYLFIVLFLSLKQHADKYVYNNIIESFLKNMNIPLSEVHANCSVMFLFKLYRIFHNIDTKNSKCISLFQLIIFGLSNISFLVIFVLIVYYHYQKLICLNSQQNDKHNVSYQSFLFQDKLNTGTDTGHKSLYMFLLSFDIGQEISMKTC